MNPAVAPLAAILDLNTDLLLNCLDGLSEAETQHRLQGGGNSLAFLIAHLTDTRHFLATRLKRPLPNRLTSLLADARSITTSGAGRPSTSCGRRGGRSATIWRPCCRRSPPRS